MKKIFYTDGACSTNGTWRGGYAVVQLDATKVASMNGISSCYYELNYIHSEFEENTTNNRQELKAIIHVLDLVDKNPNLEATIISDSAYCINMLEKWIWGWAKNGWVNSKNKTVENIDLVQMAYNYLIKNFDRCQFVKVKGHAGGVGNELADAICSENKTKFLNLIKKYNIEENYFFDN